jgi:hypothetical protein
VRVEGNCGNSNTTCKPSDLDFSAPKNGGTEG